MAGITARTRAGLVNGDGSSLIDSASEEYALLGSKGRVNGMDTHTQAQPML
jgi:hypothetical protein